MSLDTTFADLTPAADIGPPPELRWIGLELLSVDPQYQRSVDSRASRDNIARIVERFSWRKFQALTIVERDDGTFAIVDGQHRWEAAKLHPAVTAVPCLLIDARHLRDEAESFVAVNLNRVAMNPFHLHKARVVAGDPDALHLQEVCDRAGVVIPKTNLPSKDLPARGTLALSTIRDALRVYGDGPTIDALSTLAAAFPREPGSIRSALIKALVQFWALYRKGHDVDRDRLVKVLAARGAVELERGGQAYRANFGGTTITAIRAAVVKAYNERLPAEKRLPEGA